jgi:acyl-homoserine lactone acylase PvdQ
MFAAHIHEKLQLIRTVQSAPLSLPGKFACLRSLDSGLRWKVMATSSAITAPTVAVIDDAVSSDVFSSCIDGSSLNPHSEYFSFLIHSYINHSVLNRMNDV